jgi:acyl-CoA synthetase (AMP-forming)/AMP-acid ligase II
VGDFLIRAGDAGVTHILGTPSHWRRALMSPMAGRLAPRYVRLSGEVADQAILNQLAQTFPNAALTHAYASTEAGVGFEVTDGREGFPATLIAEPRGAIDIRVVDGSLRIRSPRCAFAYAGDRGALAGADGYVDTGDMVTLRDGRYFFAGRREGIINVGGQKVHPEEVEAVINRHPGVRMSQVRGRFSPITGAIVVADIVLADTVPGEPPGSASFESVKAEVLAACRQALPAHKVPAMLREVASLAVGGSGKLVRHTSERMSASVS